MREFLRWKSILERPHENRQDRTACCRHVRANMLRKTGDKVPSGPRETPFGGESARQATRSHEWTYSPGASPNGGCWSSPSPEGTPVNLHVLRSTPSSPPTSPPVAFRFGPPFSSIRRFALGDLVPGLGPGRIDDPGDVTPAGQDVAHFSAEQVGGFVRRGPRHDVVVDGADHIGVARHIAELQLTPASSSSPRANWFLT